MPDPTSPDHLSPGFLLEMIVLTLAGIPMPAGATQEATAARREAARIALLAHDPRSPQEAMLASHITVTEFAALECFRRLATPDTPAPLRVRQYNNAAAMLRLGMALTTELHRCQARRNAKARAAAPRATQAAAPAHAAQPAAPAPTPRPPAPAPRPQQHNDPMQSGKRSANMAPPAAAPPYGVDPAILKEISHRAVAAAMGRTA